MELQHMPETLEAEVVEIDGKAPARSESGGFQDTGKVTGGVFKVQLGWKSIALIILAVVILLPLVLLLGACFVAFMAMRWIWRSLTAPHPGTNLR